MNSQKSNNENGMFSIDIYRILSALWKRKILIAVVSVLCAVVFALVSGLTVTPLYRSDIMLYVNNNSISLGSTTLSINSGELNAARQILDTYIVILKSRTSLDSVIKKAGLPYSREQLKGMISAGPVNETEVFTVEVTSPNREESRIIADTIAEVLPDILTKTIKGSSVEIIDYAVVPQGSVSPGYSHYAKLGFIIGFVAVCGLIVLIEMLNDKIHDERTLMELFDNVPVIANIPNGNSGKRYSKSRYSKYGYSKYGYSSKYGYNYGYGYGYGQSRTHHEKEKTENGEK